MNDELREALAAYAHDAWSRWMKYMFENGGWFDVAHDEITPTWMMNDHKMYRWQRQMNTPYANLPENEKTSDRAEADKILSILNERTTT